jgi:hypothetical protein
MIAIAKRVEAFRQETIPVARERRAVSELTLR